jgi:hypothetical protein
MEKSSIWICFRIALLPVAGVVVFFRSYVPTNARALRPANSLMVINPYKYEVSITLATSS